MGFHECLGYMNKKPKFGDESKCICGKKYIYKKKWAFIGEWVRITTYGEGEKL